MSAVDPLLVVMNPRQIPECIDAFRDLPIRRAWLQNYTEWELVSVIASVMRDETIRFTHAILCADDCIVSEGALSAVLVAQEHNPGAVVTGFCRLDATHPEVNVTRRPLMGDQPVAGAYDFYRYTDVIGADAPVLPTGFVGFALTCMARELWQRFPFGVYGSAQQSWSSDFHLSVRLRDAGVPMLVARSGYVEHVKERWGRLDVAPEKRLLVGEAPPAVVVES